MSSRISLGAHFWVSGAQPGLRCGFFVSLCCNALHVPCRDNGTLKAPVQLCHSPVALFFSSLPHSREETIRLAEVGHEVIHRIFCGLFTEAIKIICPLPLIEEVEKMSVVP